MRPIDWIVLAVLPILVLASILLVAWLLPEDDDGGSPYP